MKLFRSMEMKFMKIRLFSNSVERNIFVSFRRKVLVIKL